MAQALVNLQGTGNETTSAVVNEVVLQVEMSQDLRLQQVLGDLSGTALANLVVAQIQLG